MRRIALALAAALLLFGSGAQAQKKSHIIGFYNLENLFDIYDDPAKNDGEFLPDGKNKWTKERYEIKVHNMARVPSPSSPTRTSAGLTWRKSGRGLKTTTSAPKQAS